MTGQPKKRSRIVVQRICSVVSCHVVLCCRCCKLLLINIDIARICIHPYIWQRFADISRWAADPYSIHPADPYSIFPLTNNFRTEFHPQKARKISGIELAGRYPFFCGEIGPTEIGNRDTGYLRGR